MFCLCCSCSYFDFFHDIRDLNIRVGRGWFNQHKLWVFSEAFLDAQGMSSCSSHGPPGEATPLAESLMSESPPPDLATPGKEDEVFLPIQGFAGE